MKRSIAFMSIAGLLALTAGCGDDKKTSPLPGAAAAPGDTATGDTVGDGTVGDGTADTINPSDLSLPSGVGMSSECMAMYTKFLTALGGIGSTDTTDLSALPEAMRSLEASLPGELKGAAETLAGAYEKLAAILAKYGGDFAKAMADPAAQADLAVLSSPEVTKASDDISAYFEKTCSGMNGVGS
jgi:hypothetical protein